DLDKRLCHARKTWVEAKEKDIVFGKDQKWADVEADETTFDRMDLGNKAPDPKNPVVWEQWCGIVQRGHPETLVLSRLSPRESAKRAPGPGAIRKVEWTPLAKKWLQDKKVILHTDSAKSYKTRVPGVLHDKVVHGKKRVKVKGQWKWKSGTQVVDRAWKFLKDRLTINQNAKVGSSLLRAKLRSAQYQYWYRNQDMWVASGTLCEWLMTKFIKKPSQ
ncbi:unnamed protein product, partial [Effrenium voratum]